MALYRIVGEHFADFKGHSFFEFVQKLCRTAGSFIRHDFKIHPSTGAVNSHKQIATTGFITHFGQVFDIDMHKSGFVVFVALFEFDRPLFDRIKRLQIGDIMTAQAPVKARARDVQIDERTMTNRSSRGKSGDFLS